jgi:hypothetical protein
MPHFTWTPRRTIGVGLLASSGVSLALGSVAAITDEWATAGCGFLLSEIAFWLGTLSFGPDFRDRLREWWRSRRGTT